MEASVNIYLAEKNRDSICLLGAIIYGIELKLKRKEKITKKDLSELRKYLSRIDKYDNTIWKQILKTIK